MIFQNSKVYFFENSAKYNQIRNTNITQDPLSLTDAVSYLNLHMEIYVCFILLKWYYYYLLHLVIKPFYYPQIKSQKSLV